MSNTSLLQVKLGTNLSAVVNMMIKQIILTEGIPFEVKMNHSACTNLSCAKRRAEME